MLWRGPIGGEVVPRRSQAARETSAICIFCWFKLRERAARTDPSTLSATQH
jgi:hypothetical protein